LILKIIAQFVCVSKKRESERHREKCRRLERLTGLTHKLQHPPQQTNVAILAFKEQFTLCAYKFSVRALNSSTEEILRKRNLIWRQTIFLPNVWSNQQKKLRAKKISMMPYISVRPSNYSAEEMEQTKSKWFQMFMWNS
jgi:hypothetical protein